MTYLSRLAYWAHHPVVLKQHEDYRDHYIIVRRLVSAPQPTT